MVCSCARMRSDYYGCIDHDHACVEATGRSAKKNAFIEGSLLQERMKSCTINHVEKTIII